MHTQAKMQAELREQLDALQISMEAEARRVDAHIGLNPTWLPPAKKLE